MRRTRAMSMVVHAGVACALAGVGTVGTVHAADAPQPRESTVSFTTTASVEVTKDLLGITLQAVRDGNDAATVQAQLKQVLDSALAEAKKAAQPGSMEVRTGNFSLSPRYGKDGRITGWQGQAELLLEGKDVPRVAQTAGRLTGMNVTGVGYSISRELIEKHEAEVMAQAIQKYRARAASYAQQFGYGSYVIRDVSVQGADQGGISMRTQMEVRAKSYSMTQDAPVPVEPGKGMLTATVSGSVALLK